ncbi:hypothetical protein DEO72_LG3g1664 [Vigna unguiculata]|uniref:Uncharacterized protein n=1 Tax=Vigna unguiculata TaxID=3917 RepID=A0A4D6LEU3_VIGUN|nr:hypothetical protein DEO72_LG3g1664 [Vigna unguiculata]
MVVHRCKRCIFQVRSVNGTGAMVRCGEDGVCVSVWLAFRENLLVRDELVLAWAWWWLKGWMQCRYALL